MSCDLGDDAADNHGSVLGLISVSNALANVAAG